MRFYKQLKPYVCFSYWSNLKMKNQNTSRSFSCFSQCYRCYHRSFCCFCSYCWCWVKCKKAHISWMNNDDILTAATFTFPYPTPTQPSTKEDPHTIPSHTIPSYRGSHRNLNTILYILSNGWRAEWKWEWHCSGICRPSSCQVQQNFLYLCLHIDIHRVYIWYVQCT